MNIDIVPAVWEIIGRFQLNTNDKRMILNFKQSNWSWVIRIFWFHVQLDSIFKSSPVGTLPAYYVTWWRSCEQVSGTDFPAAPLLGNQSWRKNSFSKKLYKYTNSAAQKVRNAYNSKKFATRQVKIMYRDRCFKRSKILELKLFTQNSRCGPEIKLSSPSAPHLPTKSSSKSLMSLSCLYKLLILWGYRGGHERVCMWRFNATEILNLANDLTVPVQLNRVYINLKTILIG